MHLHITSGQSNLRKRPHWRHTRTVQSYSPGCANMHPHATKCFLGRTGVHIPNEISIGSAIFAQLTAESSYTLQWAASFPIKIAPLHGDLDPIYYMILWAQPSRQPKRHLNQFSHFCTAQGTVSLYFTMGRPFSPSKLPFYMGDVDPM